MRLTIKPIPAFIVIVLIFAGGFAVAKSIPSTPPISSSDALVAKYPLLAKRIFLDTPNDTLLNFVPLRKQLEQKLSGVTAPYSIYFEYLPTGTTMRIGSDQEFVGASLLKLPVVMDLYRASEEHKINLDSTVTLTQSMINDQFGDLWKRGVGAKLSLRQAAKLALSESDNTAILAIQQGAPTATPDDTALEVVDADYNVQSDQVLINSKSYTSILKCLYFSCYLNTADSQEILSYLTQSSFSAGIAKPIPDNVPVAHKIGEQYNTLTASDCGIVYVPRRPYALCVMLGLPAADAVGLMADASALVYQAVTTSN